MSDISIDIEGNIDDRLRSIVHLVGRLAPLRSAPAHTRAILDLTKLRYLGPDGVALLVGSILEARKRQVIVDVLTSAKSGPLAAFFAFSGFNQMALDGAPPETGHPDNVTAPLRRFDQSRHGDVEPIIRLISRFEPVSDDLRLSLEIAINECIQNIEDHARSPIGGIGCARFMKGTREIRVALMDWGTGILASLRSRYSDTVDDVHALRRVLYGGYSALTRRNNLGRGIDNLRSVVTESFGGDLYIVSGHGAADIHGRQPPRYTTLPSGYAGTMVCFTLPMEPRP